MKQAEFLNTAFLMDDIYKLKLLESFLLQQNE